MAEEVLVPQAQSLVNSGGLMAKSVKAQKSAAAKIIAGNRPVATILSGRALRRAQSRRKQSATNK